MIWLAAVCLLVPCQSSTWPNPFLPETSPPSPEPYSTVYYEHGKVANLAQDHKSGGRAGWPAASAAPIRRPELIEPHHGRDAVRRGGDALLQEEEGAAPAASHWVRCTACDRPFATHQGLSTHKFPAHDTRRVEEEKGRMVVIDTEEQRSLYRIPVAGAGEACPLCTERFVGKSAFSRHNLTDHKDSTLAHFECDKIYRHYSHLRSHKHTAAGANYIGTVCTAPATKKWYSKTGFQKKNVGPSVVENTQGEKVPLEHGELWLMVNELREMTSVDVYPHWNHTTVQECEISTAAKESECIDESIGGLAASQPSLPTLSAMRIFKQTRISYDDECDGFIGWIQMNLSENLERRMIERLSEESRVCVDRARTAFGIASCFMLAVLQLIRIFSPYRLPMIMLILIISLVSPPSRSSGSARLYRGMNGRPRSSSLKAAVYSGFINGIIFVIASFMRCCLCNNRRTKSVPVYLRVSSISSQSDRKVRKTPFLKKWMEWASVMLRGAIEMSIVIMACSVSFIVRFPRVAFVCTVVTLPSMVTSASTSMDLLTSSFYDSSVWLWASGILILLGSAFLLGVKIGRCEKNREQQSVDGSDQKPEEELDDESDEEGGDATSSSEASDTRQAAGRVPGSASVTDTGSEDEHLKPINVMRRKATVSTDSDFLEIDDRGEGRVTFSNKNNFTLFIDWVREGADPFGFDVFFRGISQGSQDVVRMRGMNGNEVDPTTVIIKVRDITNCPPYFDWRVITSSPHKEGHFIPFLGECGRLIARRVRGTTTTSAAAAVAVTAKKSETSTCILHRESCTFTGLAPATRTPSAAKMSGGTGAKDGQTKTKECSEGLQEENVLENKHFLSHLIPSSFSHPPFSSASHSSSSHVSLDFTPRLSDEALRSSHSDDRSDGGAASGMVCAPPGSSSPRDEVVPFSSSTPSSEDDEASAKRVREQQVEPIETAQVSSTPRDARGTSVPLDGPPAAVDGVKDEPSNQEYECKDEKKRDGKTKEELRSDSDEETAQVSSTPRDARGTSVLLDGPPAAVDGVKVRRSYKKAIDGYARTSFKQLQDSGSLQVDPKISEIDHRDGGNSSHRLSNNKDFDLAYYAQITSKKFTASPISGIVPAMGTIELTVIRHAPKEGEQARRLDNDVTLDLIYCRKDETKQRPEEHFNVARKEINERDAGKTTIILKR